MFNNSSYTLRFKILFLASVCLTRWDIRLADFAGAYLPQYRACIWIFSRIFWFYFLNYDLESIYFDPYYYLLSSMMVQTYDICPLMVIKSFIKHNNNRTKWTEPCWRRISCFFKDGTGGVAQPGGLVPQPSASRRSQAIAGDAGLADHGRRRPVLPEYHWDYHDTKTDRRQIAARSRAIS